ncbi:MAG: hypothetical protein JNK43_05695 [Ignavibacteria bacterium]|nr:hypothetical protein [Ignavibacteria bacterium]
MKRTNRTFGLLLAAVCLLFSNFGILYSQSPYYTLKFSVGDSGTINHNDEYVIDVTSCQFDYDPVVPSGDYWFGRDTSRLDWKNLPDSVLKTISCVNFVKNGSVYENSNQAMVWEIIYAIKIVRNSSDTMMIVFPVKIKSFVTFMDLGNVTFKAGIFDLTDDIVYSYNQGLKLEIPVGYNWLPGERDKGLLKSINLTKQK